MKEYFEISLKYKKGLQMDSWAVFVSTFFMVFVGEIGDKTQIAAGTSVLNNKTRIGVIFMSSILALTCVAALTIFFSTLLPRHIIYSTIIAGGCGMIIYGLYLYKSASMPSEAIEKPVVKHICLLFFTHFLIVFVAELGDKTQIITLASSLKNQLYPITVFLGSTSALITVTTITVWGITKVPKSWTTKIQKIGAILMIVYGIYMLQTKTLSI